MELPKSVRKHIRTQKGLIRRMNGGKDEQRKAINDLYAKFGIVRKGAAA